MKILFVCPTPPLDRSYGSAVRTNNMWRSLKSVGDVDTLVLIGANETKVMPRDEANEIARIQFLKPTMPWPTAKSRAIEALVAQALAGRHYDVAVIRYVRIAMFAEPSISASWV